MSRANKVYWRIGIVDHKDGQRLEYHVNRNRKDVKEMQSMCRAVPIDTCSGEAMAGYIQEWMDEVRLLGLVHVP